MITEFAQVMFGKTKAYPWLMNPFRVVITLKASLDATLYSVSLMMAQMSKYCRGKRERERLC
jgi:hypothetical protein